MVWAAMVGGLVALLGMFISAVYPSLFDSVIDLAAVCLVTLSVSIALAFASFRANPKGILFNSLGYMIVAATVYFSFGPLFYAFGPEHTLEGMPAILRISYSSACFVTFLNLLGVAIACLAFSAFRFSTLEDAVARAAAKYRSVRVIPCWISLCAVGMAAKFFVVLPFEFSQVSAPPSAVFRLLSNFTTVGILMGWQLADRRRPFVLAFAVILTLEEIAVGFLMLNKSVIVLSALMAMLGRYTRTQKRLTLALGIPIVVALYVFATPLVSFGRWQIGYDVSGRQNVATLGDRVEIVTDYVTERGGDKQFYASGRWWNRLNYLPLQVIAMRLYDNGKGGDLVEKAPWLLVPRSLYPEKPIMTSGGIEFTRQVFGSTESSTGMGVFINGYYNIGWLGFVFGALAYGLALRIAFAVARPVAAGGTVLLAPLVGPAIYIGLRADGDILNDVLGATTMVLAVAGCAVFLSKFLASRGCKIR